MASKELEKVTSAQALAKADFGDDGGTGYEGQTQDDMLIPFLSILEKGTPGIDDIKGAKPGMLFNTVTKELFKNGVTIIPAKTVHSFVEWTKREDGQKSKQVGQHRPDSDVVIKAKQTAKKWNKLEHDGNDLKDTFYIYALLVDGDEIKGPVVISCSSSRISEYRRWNTTIKTHMVNGIVPPPWANRVTVATEFNKTPEYTWYTFLFGPLFKDLPSSLVLRGSVLYEAGKAIAKSIEEGTATAAFNSQDDGEKEDGEEVFA